LRIAPSRAPKLSTRRDGAGGYLWGAQILKQLVGALSLVATQVRQQILEYLRHPLGASGLLKPRRPVPVALLRYVPAPQLECFLDDAVI
jgi:hypothetical protein